MNLWQRIRKRKAEPGPGTPSVSAAGSAPVRDQGVRFSDMVRQLSSADEAVRREMAFLLSGLGYRGAVQPLIRAYMREADPELLDALRPFGARLVSEAAREVRDLALGPIQRARLMDVLGASNDPGAIALVRPVAREEEPIARTAACMALAALGDPEGVRLLAEDLLRQDVRSRARAMRALERIGGDEPQAVLAEHVRRYLASGGAIPAPIGVTMPLLVDTDPDVAQLVAEHIGSHRRSFNVVTGPGVNGIAERQRETLEALLPGHRLIYATARHSLDEQAAALQRASTLVAPGIARPVVFVGPLPPPEDVPLPDLLATRHGRLVEVRIIIVGPRKPAFVLDWWRYVVEPATVPTEMLVVLTIMVLGRSELTAEEELIQQRISERDRDAFARAVLAHL